MQCVVSRACLLITMFKADKHCGACRHTQEAGVQPMKRKGKKKQRYWVCSRPRRKSALSVRTKKKGKKRPLLQRVCVCVCMCRYGGKKKRNHKTTVYSCKEPALSDKTHTSQSTHESEQRKRRESKSMRTSRVSKRKKKEKKKKATRTRTKLRSLCRTHNSIIGFFFAGRKSAKQEKQTWFHVYVFSLLL